MKFTPKVWNFPPNFSPPESPRPSASTYTHFGGTKCQRGRSYERSKVYFGDFWPTPPFVKPFSHPNGLTFLNAGQSVGRGFGRAIQKSIRHLGSVRWKKSYGRKTADFSIFDGFCHFSRSRDILSRFSRSHSYSTFSIRVFWYRSRPRKTLGRAKHLKSTGLW